MGDTFMRIRVLDGSKNTAASGRAAAEGLAEQPMGLEHKARDARIRAVLATIERHPHRSVRELASEVKLSPRRLECLFRNETGANIRDFLIGERLRMAAHLLTTSELSIKEIAYAIGYGHPSSFTRAFERRFVQSPKHYRQQSMTQNAK
jgi:transcriptional regulator GlxA family with amidase domain